MALEQRNGDLCMEQEGEGIMGGVCCPHCGGFNVSYSQYLKEWHCNRCGRDFT